MDSDEITAVLAEIRGVRADPAADAAALLGLDASNPFGIPNAGVRRAKKRPQHIVLRRLKERLKAAVKDRLRDQIKPINAEVVREYLPEEGESTFFLMNGNCEYADFLLAFHRELEERGDEVTELLATTLSVNAHTFDVLDHFRCRKHLLVSSYFLATDKANTLFAMQEAGRLESYNIGFFRNHTKITLLGTRAGARYVFCGSANLRSSSTIEQFTVEHCAETYAFVWRWLHPLIEQHNFAAERERWKSGPANLYGVLDAGANA